MTTCQQLLQHGAIQDVTEFVTEASSLIVAAFCGSDQVMDILLNVDSGLQHLEQPNINLCTLL